MITQPILRDFWERVVLPTMRNGEWFTSEKVAQYMPRNLKTKKFTYNISVHLSRLYRETFLLERVEQRRIAFSRNGLKTGKWAYRIKLSVLEQLKKDSQRKIQFDDGRADDDLKCSIMNDSLSTLDGHQDAENP